MPQQWEYAGGSNQKWYLKDAGNGYYDIINVNRGKGLDVADASTADGGNVQQWSVTGSGGANQQWQIVAFSGGYYRMINRNSGKALDIADVSTVNGVNVHQWAYTGGGTTSCSAFKRHKARLKMPRAGPNCPTTLWASFCAELRFFDSFLKKYRKTLAQNDKCMVYSNSGRDNNAGKQEKQRLFLEN